MISAALSYLPILRQLADIWATLAAGTVAGICLCVAAYLFPIARQLLIGLAVACFAASFMFAWGVKQERDVCTARQVRAEAQRVERDANQDKFAKADEAKEDSGLKKIEDQEQKSESEYERAASKPNRCTLTVDDLR